MGVEGAFVTAVVGFAVVGVAVVGFVVDGAQVEGAFVGFAVDGAQVEGAFEKNHKSMNENHMYEVLIDKTDVHLHL